MFAINLRSDNDTAKPIRKLWTDCGVLERCPSMAESGYPPHITLAVYDDLDPRTLFRVFDHAFSSQTAICVRFDRLGYFETTEKLIVWASPTLPDQMREIHQQIHSAIGAELCQPNYRPGVWIPHCSLATAIDVVRKQEVVDLVSRPVDPIEVLFDVADCASFMPIEVLRELGLPTSVAETGSVELAEPPD